MKIKNAFLLCLIATPSFALPPNDLTDQNTSQHQSHYSHEKPCTKRNFQKLEEFFKLLSDPQTRHTVVSKDVLHAWRSIFGQRFIKTAKGSHHTLSTPYHAEGGWLTIPNEHPHHSYSGDYLHRLECFVSNALQIYARDILEDQSGGR